MGVSDRRRAVERLVAGLPPLSTSLMLVQCNGYLLASQHLALARARALSLSLSLSPSLSPSLARALSSSWCLTTSVWWRL